MFQPKTEIVLLVGTSDLGTISFTPNIWLLERVLDPSFGLGVWGGVWTTQSQE